MKSKDIDTIGRQHRIANVCKKHGVAQQKRNIGKWGKPYMN